MGYRCGPCCESDGLVAWEVEWEGEGCWGAGAGLLQYGGSRSDKAQAEEFVKVMLGATAEVRWSVRIILLLPRRVIDHDHPRGPA